MNKNSIIGEISPLYEYWHSSQDDIAVIKMQKIINEESFAANLLKYEPYKWENLYQSIVREIVNGDMSSLKGFNVILGSINESERNKLLEDLCSNAIFSQEIISIIKNPLKNNNNHNRNIFRTIRILTAIFTNPYGIEIKRKKNHIYEYSGTAINIVRKLFN